MAIPRVLHLTSARVPLAGVEHAFFRRNARLLGPEWTYRIWSDADNESLVAQHFPELVEAYRALPHGVMRADLSRLVYMHAEGGWYADTDYEWLRDPTEATAAYDLVLPLARDAVNPGAEQLGNAVFGSIAGHTFWAAALRDALTTPSPPGLPTTKVEDATGPGLMTRHREVARTDSRAWLAPRRYFHPPVSASLTSSVAFGMHHTRGSWRTNAISWRVRMAQRQLLRTVARWRRRERSRGAQ